MIKAIAIFFPCLVLHLYVFAQGKLFIIGGGVRTPEIMQALAHTANMHGGDYTVVLPMATEKTDSAFRYFKADYFSVMNNPVFMFNFTGTTNNLNWLDSLRHAKLVYITGGDQDRFMNIVGHGSVYTAIHDAYNNGATIAGSSAGAAVMNEHMITGKQLIDTDYNITFKKIISNNIEIKPGLGFVTKAIIDQHFIVRSRYNRLLSAMELYPALTAIGIDESTALIIEGNHVTVVGNRQVVVFRHPKQIRVTKEGLIKYGSIECSIYTAGDTFRLK